jgi:hypothetical protein
MPRPPALPRISTPQALAWTLAVGGAAAAVAIALTTPARDAKAQANPTAPSTCTCSAPTNLPGPQTVASVIVNCQCGSLQCVATFFVPPVKPEGHGPTLACTR